MTALQGIVHDLDENEYHAHPALSSTQARQILDSPARFNYNRTHPQPHKDAFDLGTAVHTKVLGVGAHVITYPDEHLTPSGAVSTKAATVAWAEEQRANGFVVIGTAQAAQVDGMAEAVLAHPTARALLEQPGALSEASVFTTDTEWDVPIRARFDLLAPITVDLKTTAKEASPSGFAKSVANFGYDVQQGHYLDAHELATGGRPNMVFVVVETTAPHLVGVHQLDRDFADMGQVKARYARQRFAECTASGVWPGYPTQIGLIPPPVYAVYDFQDNYS